MKNPGKMLKPKRKSLTCPKCNGEGSYIYHQTLEELKSLAEFGGTTNYDPSYSKKCEKCKGKGKIKSPK